MWIQDPAGVRIVLVEIPAGTRCAATRDQPHRQGDQTRTARAGHLSRQTAAANRIRCKATRYAVRDTLLNCLSTPAWFPIFEV